MVEQWIGPEAMQRGIRTYIRAHAWGNAEAADLLHALDEASGRDVSGLAATFLDRPGVPNVAVTSACADGKLKLGLRQSAWHPLAIPTKEGDRAPWRIPFCVETGARTPAGKEPARTCIELAEAHGSLEAPAQACPLAFLPNPEQAGYFRVVLGDADLKSLALRASQLDVSSKMGLIANTWAGVRAGTVRAEVLFDLLAAFDGETNGDVLATEARTLRDAEQSLVDEAARPAFQAYVVARLGRAKKTLGWQPKKDEPADLSLARSAVLSAMAFSGRDLATIKEAEALTKRWLKDPSSLDPDLASTAVPIASLSAGPARLDELRQALKAAKTPAEQSVAVDAMGAFADPGMLERAWSLALTSELRQQDAMSIFGDAGARSTRARLFFPWLQAHWDEAKRRAPAGSQQTLVYLVSSACTQSELDAERSFFEPRAKELEGASRPLALYSEKAASCAALRAREGEATTTYLRSRSKR